MTRFLSRMLLVLFLSFTGLLWSGAALAETPCTRTTKVADFREAQIQAEDAFALGDEGALHAARDAAVLALRCIGDRLPGDEAAAFHRMIAMVAFTFGDEARVVGELQRAILLDPDYYDPGTASPDDHRFIQLYAEASQLPAAETEMLSPPSGGFVLVDGVRDAGRPLGVASIVQVFNADFMLVETVYLPPGAESPSWGRTVQPLVDESFVEAPADPVPGAPSSNSTPATAPAAAEPGGDSSNILWVLLGAVGGVVVGLFLCCFLSFILYYAYY